MVNRAIAERNHIAGAVYALPLRFQRLVDRACIDFYRRFRFHQPHDNVQRMRAGYHHRRNLRRIVGAFVVIDCNQPVHERTRRDHRDFAQCAGSDFFLGDEPAATESLRIADHRVDFRLLYGIHDHLRLSEIGCQRLFDQQRMAAFKRGKYRVHMQVLVSGNDDRVDFRTPDEFAEIGSHELGTHFVRDQFGAFGIGFRYAYPADLRMARGKFPADQADTARADDSQADFFWLPSHLAPPTAASGRDSGNGRLTG